MSATTIKYTPVWVLHVQDAKGGSRGVSGVFTTREAAEAAAKEQGQDNPWAEEFALRSV